MTDNSTRADLAEDALHAYITAKGEAFMSDTSEIADLIADLLHLAARYAEEDSGEMEAYVEKALRLARLHFDTEHGNPEEEST